MRLWSNPMRDAGGVSTRRGEDGDNTTGCRGDFVRIYAGVGCIHRAVDHRPGCDGGARDGRDHLDRDVGAHVVPVRETPRPGVTMLCRLFDDGGRYGMWYVS